MPGPAREFDENEVVEAAVRAFWERGFEGTRLSTILEEVGLGRQSLYNAFESKEALYVAALRRYRRDVIGGIVTVLDGPGSPRERIRTVFGALESNVANGECPGCFVANAIADFGRTSPVVLAEIEGTSKDLTEAFARTLDEGRSLGEIRDSIDSVDVARVLTTLVEGVSLFNRVESGPGFAAGVRRGVESLLDP